MIPYQESRYNDFLEGSKMAQDLEIPLPARWPEHVKSAVLHVVSLGSMAFTSALGLASKRCDKLVRLRAKL